MGYYAPKTLPDALEILAGQSMKIVAGCTDFFPILAEGPAPENLLDISRVSGLRGISGGEAGWTFGAATTWTDIIQADLPPAFDGLKSAARQVGSMQIQNAGTVAGNLCNASPAADGVPPLLTLDAQVKLQSAGASRVVPLSDFITDVRRIDLHSDELLTSIYIPQLPQNSTSHFLKLGSRKYLVISIAMVSTLIALDDAGLIEDARIAVGSCSAVAQRLRGLEAALQGLSAEHLRYNPDIWADHLDELSPIGDVRGSASYRQEAAAELCRRAVLAAIAESGNFADG